MLSDRSQKGKDQHQKETRTVIIQGLVSQRNGHVLVRGYTFKINKIWRSNIQHGDYSSYRYIICLKVPKRVDLKCSHHKKEMVIM